MLKHEILTQRKLARIPACIQKQPSSSVGYPDTCRDSPKRKNATFRTRLKIPVHVFPHSLHGFYLTSGHIPSNSSLTILAFHVLQSELMTALLNKWNLCSVENREGYKHLLHQIRAKRGQNRNRAVPRWSWVTSAVLNNKRNEKANDSICLSALWWIKRIVGENGKFQSSSHW